MGTAGIRAVSPPPDLVAVSARLFRRLSGADDLHTGVHVVVVPAGTPCYAAPSLGGIARQISAASATDPGPAPRGRHRQAGTSP
jgi:hypothetical protein